MAPPPASARIALVLRLIEGMSRHLRFIPDGGALVEVTCRTIQGRLLLCPSPQLNDIVLGVLGRAQREYPAEVVAFAFASNHYQRSRCHPFRRDAGSTGGQQGPKGWHLLGETSPREPPSTRKGKTHDGKFQSVNPG